MSFFNKKEDVIDIELTQFGKYLMSKGKFKPVFYTFSDDEILYNNAYVSPDADKYNETGKQTSNRIQRETPRFKTLYDQEGIETRIQKKKAYEKKEFSNLVSTPIEFAYGNDYMYEERMGADDRKLVRNFLGHSTIGEQKVPSWELDSLLHGNFDVKNLINSSSGPHIGMKRPVLEFEIDHTLNIYNLGTGDKDYSISSDQFNSRYIGLEKEFNFVDDIKVKIEEGVLIFSVVEENSDYELENFEVDFFEVKRGPNFNNPDGTVKEEELEILYTTEKEYSDNQNKTPIGPQYINYYFDILSDQGLADYYGFDLRGINRKKLKDLFTNFITDYYDRLSRMENTGMLPSFADGDPINRIPRTLNSMGEIGQTRAGLLDDGDDPRNRDNSRLGTGNPSSRSEQAPSADGASSQANIPVSLGDEEDICDD